jgi:hypothetical protein
MESTTDRDKELVALRQLVKQMDMHIEGLMKTGPRQVCPECNGTCTKCNGVCATCVSGE